MSVVSNDGGVMITDFALSSPTETFEAAESVTPFSKLSIFHALLSFSNGKVGKQV